MRAMTSTMEHEEAQVRELFERVDAVVEVAHVIEGDHPGEAARLLTVSRNALSQASPVRVPIAARLLLVSDKTVRAWVNEGLLKPQSQRPRLLLDTEQLHDVLQFVRELRARGEDRDLLTKLWQRLEDEALLDRDDLAESLEQTREGLATPAMTLEEERSTRR
jgi:DNA-binding transcriptional MerR regulator